MRPGESLLGTVQPESGAAPPVCHDEVCVTCADEAVEVRVTRLLGDGLAVVATESGPEEVSVALVPARVGDTVLVHAKEAIAVIGGRDGGHDGGHAGGYDGGQRSAGERGV